MYDIFKYKVSSIDHHSIAAHLRVSSILYVIRCSVIPGVNRQTINSQLASDYGTVAPARVEWRQIIYRQATGVDAQQACYVALL